MEESRAAIFMLVSYEYQLLKVIHLPLSVFVETFMG